LTHPPAENRDHPNHVGPELALFADTIRWKRYVHARISAYICGRVLEVGGKVGAFTEYLAPLSPDQWSCLEPNLELLAEIARRQTEGRIPGTAQSVNGTMPDIPTGIQFDTTLYLDVLEHIDDHAAEAAYAADRLVPGGHLIILVARTGVSFRLLPIRHCGSNCRRYTGAGHAANCPNGLTSAAAFYMDSLGLMLSLANRLLLRNSTPRKAQIAIWDRAIVPIARVLDHLFGPFLAEASFPFGKNSRSGLYQSAHDKSRSSHHRWRSPPPFCVRHGPRYNPSNQTRRNPWT